MLLPLLAIGFFLVMGTLYSGSPTKQEINRKFIVVNPIDLSQITGLSKYRSCVGHDFRAPVITTGKKEATPRSMKNYIKVKEELKGKNGVVKAIAPFDGKITNIANWEEVKLPEDMEVWLAPDGDPKNPRQWNFIFFHIDLRDDLKKGSKVKAGEVIGYAYLTRGPENSTDNFDMSVKFTRPMFPPVIDVPLAHVVDEVLAEYKALGATLTDMEISKEYRDQNSCPITGEERLGDIFFPPTSDPKDWVYFK